MKKFLFATMIVAVALLQSSCVSTKKIKYFQGADSVYAQAQRIRQMYEMRIKPADQIMIKVHCDEPELLEIFANSVTMAPPAGPVPATWVTPPTMPWAATTATP